MKNIFLLGVFVFLFSAITSSQTYNQLRDSAAKFREKKDYATAFELLTRGMEKSAGQPYHNDIYDAAALASLTRMNDTSLFYLNQLLATGEHDMIIYDAR